MKCTVCHHESLTRDPFLDLSLEIAGCTSLNDAIYRFSRPEMLDGANRYRCSRYHAALNIYNVDRCKKPVVASKQFLIDQSPPVLTIHFKRFTFCGFGRKITKLVSYPLILNLPLANGKACFLFPQTFNIKECGVQFICGSCSLGQNRTIGTLLCVCQVSERSLVLYE